MNTQIIDPLQGDFPELIEEYLEHGIMKCIAFNRRGTLLAAGCTDGSCVIWDFMTRGIAKELRDKDCNAGISSVCWSKSGHHILVSAADNSVILYNVSKGEIVFKTTLQQMPLQARLPPGGNSSQPPSICLISPFSSAPFILDFHTKMITSLPISLTDSGSTLATSSRNKFPDGYAHYTPTAACFNKFGDLVYLGNSVGEILIIDHKKNKICGIVSIPGGAVIKNIIFSRNGQYLLTNSSDRTIRVYENLLPLKNSLKSLELNEINDSVSEIEQLKTVGLKCLSLFREFQDSITKVHWKAPCFSGDSEWVVGGSASKGEHKIYIWDRAGLLVKILEGPKEALVDLVWHPVRPIVVSVSLTGLIYIWAKDYTENWSAFAPDFKELEENEEYVEQEDEFDLMAETEKVKESGLNEDVEVDITTVEKDSQFSDSDISQDELYFLPSDPCPDTSGSPLSEGTRVNGQTMNHDLSLIEGVENSGAEECGGTRLKRRRKPSKKLLELQAFEVTQNTKASDCSYTESGPIQDGDDSITLGIEQLNPPIKKRLTSSVWKFFKKVKRPDGETVAVCNHCNKSYSADGGSGTSHLRRHIRREHPEPTDSSQTESDSSTDTDEPVTELKGVNPVTKFRSAVWNYYKQVKKGNNKIFAVCNFCSLKLVAGDVGTTSLRKHLMRKHANYVDVVALRK